MHPNLTNVDTQRKRDMLALEHPNLTIILPDAAIDSYALLKASDIVACFGSTVGCEAVFWDRPSVLLGPSFYQGLGGIYQPTTHEESISLLASTLAPKNKLGALKYGYWLQTRGHRHKHFQSSGLFEGQFKGETLYARPKHRSKWDSLKTKASQLLKTFS